GDEGRQHPGELIEGSHRCRGAAPAAPACRRRWRAAASVSNRDPPAAARRGNRDSARPTSGADLRDRASAGRVSPDRTAARPCRCGKVSGRGKKRRNILLKSRHGIVRISVGYTNFTGKELISILCLYARLQKNHIRNAKVAYTMSINNRLYFSYA